MLELERAARPQARPRCPAASASASRWGGRWCGKPQVFLLDEPLSNLDAKLRMPACAWRSRALHRQLGTTMVYVTHDQIEAMTLGERIVVLKDGHDAADRYADGAVRPSGQPVRRRPSSAARR